MFWQTPLDPVQLVYAAAAEAHLGLPQQGPHHLHLTGQVQKTGTNILHIVDIRLLGCIPSSY